MTAPTYEDAQIMLQMARWGTEMISNKAGRFVWSDDYIEDYQEFIKKYPPGSKEYDYVSQICSWYEALGALWANGLFNEKLLGDWILVSARWDRLKGFALGFREERGNERVFEHFENMAKKF